MQIIKFPFPFKYKELLDTGSHRDKKKVILKIQTHTLKTLLELLPDCLKFLQITYMGNNQTFPYMSCPPSFQLSYQMPIWLPFRPFSLELSSLFPWILQLPASCQNFSARFTLYLPWVVGLEHGRFEYLSCLLLFL